MEPNSLSRGEVRTDCGYSHCASSRVELTDTTLSSEAKANFRYQQGAHGWSSENITNQSPGDQSRGFSTADSPLAWLSCMRSACDQSTLPIDVQVFHCKARDPHVEA
ncbi:hypothetical protein TNCV_3283981 [Trichonephila clavipes]|nr:hypothetical protein TNCV_3283981 [Trichonephila clavipes]